MLKNLAIETKYKESEILPGLGRNRAGDIITNVSQSKDFKTMIAFEVQLNGEKLIRAGQEDMCVLSTTINALGVLGNKSAGTKTIKDSFELSYSVGGLSSESDEDPGQHFQWISKPELKIDDEILVRIIEVKSADAPISSKPTQPLNVAEREKKWWEQCRDYYLKHKDKYEKNG
ncbi:MAG: hypothetical protein GY699_25980 [Desulfobacteraceae bacterium]|nr:hypothetical protein [Desulfobacteraceae bacterium]